MKHWTGLGPGIAKFNSIISPLWENHTPNTVGPKGLKMGHFRLFWYSLYISSPNLAYGLALCSQLFRHRDRHKILNGDVTNHDVTNILDIKFSFSRKKLCCLKHLNERNLIPKTIPCYDKSFASYGKLKQKSLSPPETCWSILFLRNRNPWQTVFSFFLEWPKIVWVKNFSFVFSSDIIRSHNRGRRP